MNKTENKGATLAYTLIFFVLIFAMCALITTTILAQNTYSDSYAKTSEISRDINQIGDLFCDVSGDYYIDGVSNAQNSPFALALLRAEIEITEYDDYWTASKNLNTYKLKFSTNAAIRTIYIFNENTLYLSVSIDISKNKVLTFNKGIQS